MWAFCGRRFESFVTSARSQTYEPHALLKRQALRPSACTWIAWGAVPHMAARSGSAMSRPACGPKAIPIATARLVPLRARASVVRARYEVRRYAPNRFGPHCGRAHDRPLFAPVAYKFQAFPTPRLWRGLPIHAGSGRNPIGCDSDRAAGLVRPPIPFARRSGRPAVPSTRRGHALRVARVRDAKGCAQAASLPGIGAGAPIARRVAFVEDQIDYFQHRRRPARALFAAWRLEGHARFR